MKDYPQVCFCCIFLVVVYPVEIAFSKSCPRIVVEVKEADTTDTTTQHKKSHTKSTQEINATNPAETRTITQEEKEKLTTGM